MRQTALFLPLTVVFLVSLAHASPHIRWKASGKGGAVAAGHGDAVAAGIWLLDAGGNAAALSAKLGTWVEPCNWTVVLADKETEDPSL